MRNAVNTFSAERSIFGCLVNAGLGSHRQDVGWGYLIRSTLNNYQSWFVLLIIILATGAAVLVGKCIHAYRYGSTVFVPENHQNDRAFQKYG